LYKKNNSKQRRLAHSFIQMQRTGDFVEGLADHVVEFALGRGDEGLDADEAGKLADGLAVDVGEAQLLVEVLDF
jgi:hypothetical protein